MARKNGQTHKTDIRKTLAEAAENAHSLDGVMVTIASSRMQSCAVCGDRYVKFKPAGASPFKLHQHTALSKTHNAIVHVKL